MCALSPKIFPMLISRTHLNDRALAEPMRGPWFTPYKQKFKNKYLLKQISTMMKKLDSFYFHYIIPQITITALFLLKCLLESENSNRLGSFITTGSTAPIPSLPTIMLSQQPK